MRQEEKERAHLITTFDYDMIDGISDEAVVIDLETILYFSKEMN